MAITTLLFISVARQRWRWSAPRVALVAGSFLLIDLAFLGANALKVLDGGWIPLVIGAVVFVLLVTWRRGRALLRAAEESYAAGTPDVKALLTSITTGSAARVHGTAVYLHGSPVGVPRTLLHNLKHNRVVHDRVIFLTILTDDVPTVPESERTSLTELAAGFWRVVARYGFMEEPDVPALLALLARDGLEFRPLETSYFLGRETVISAEKPGMARWRERLFGWMNRNASPATSYFGLPPNRVVELGAQVEI